MSQPEENFRIGAVSRMTGVPTGTLRTWEQRHGALWPQQQSSGRHRLYGPEQVERARLLKHLVSSGDSIGVIAQLRTENLRSRARALQASPSFHSYPQAAPRPTLCVLHRGLAVQLQSDEAIARFEPRATTGSLEELLTYAESENLKVDVLVADLELLSPQPLENLAALEKQLQPKAIVVSYHFARSADLRPLAQRGVSLLRLPMETARLVHFIDSLVSAPESASTAAAAPRFTAEQLAELTNSAPQLACECPVHLSSILEALMAFERYSVSCIDTSPSDASVHQALARGTALARIRMEDMLEMVLAYEGLEVPPHPTDSELDLTENADYESGTGEHNGNGAG